MCVSIATNEGLNIKTDYEYSFTLKITFFSKSVYFITFYVTSVARYRMQTQ